MNRDFTIRVGIDSNRVAIACAKSTSKDTGMRNAKFYKGDAEKVFFDIFDRNKRNKNILFVDPPRAGVNRGFLEKIRACREADAVYYLSCDPATLARDIKVMTDGEEWGLGRVVPFDMFPRTGHIEVLAEFVRGGE